MKKLFAILLLSLFNLSAPVQAGTRMTTASFQVSLTINEACAVQSGAARPVVNCQYATPYQVNATTPQADAPMRGMTSAPVAHDGQQIWTVTF